MEQAMIKKKISPTMELIKSAGKIYSERFWSFVGMGLLPVLGMVPLALIFLIYYGLSQAFKNQPTIQMVYVVLGLLGLASLAILIYIALSAHAGLILLLKNNSNKIGETFKLGRNYAWPLLVTGLLTGVLVLLWTILFVVPGIIFGLYYSLWSFALIMEDKRNMATLRRSKELITGYWWPVIGRYLLVGLIISAISWILSLPTNVMAAGSAAKDVYGAISGVFNFLAGQISLIFSYLIYKDLVAIKGDQPAAIKR